jgi:hypothetical protein
MAGRIRLVTHIQKQKLSQVHLHLQLALSFAGGCVCFTSTNAEVQALLLWPLRSPDLRPCYFFFLLRTLSFHRPSLRFYMRREYESSLPSQKSIVTCCSGYRWKWISTWGLPCHKWRTYTARVSYTKNKKNLGNFSFHLLVACYNPNRQSNLTNLWNVSGNY